MRLLMKKIHLFPATRPLGAPLFFGICFFLLIVSAIPYPPVREVARNIAEGIGVGVGVSLWAYYFS